MTEKVEQIVAALGQKASIKQAIYRNTFEIFQHMKDHASKIADYLSEKFEKVDPNVKIVYKEVNDFEFRIRFSGDMLIFTMHSNVTTFQHEHVIFKSPYIKEDENRAYFGQVMVYNFMADSLKYNRINDPGYLLARMMINQDNHFYIEGQRQLAFLYPDIAKNEISEDMLSDFIESAMLLAIDQDLYVPSFQKVQIIPLSQKLKNQMVAGGNKVGFQMSYERD